MHHRRLESLEDRKGGISSSIVSTILVIVAIGVVLTIVIGALTNGFRIFPNLFSKYTPPKINDSSVFLYDIKEFSISNVDEAGCTVDADDDRRYDCKADKYIDFSEQISNGGTRMRKIIGGIIVCKAECRRGNCNPAKECDQRLAREDFDAKGAPCYVTNGQDSECEAGSYKFSRGSYIVYPAAKCELDQTVGCYSSAMSVADKVYTPSKAIEIIVS